MNQSVGRDKRSALRPTLGRQRFVSTSAPDAPSVADYAAGG